MRSILAISALVIGGCAICQADNTPTEIPFTPIKLPGQPSKPLRPHDEETAVHAYYDNGEICIFFESYEGMASATLTNLFTGETYSWTFSTASQPAAHYIGATPGSYSISITTRDNSYEGFFAID